MTHTPRVTVLMPVYNAETYLQEAVESILRQTFADFEFLIIDDASTDTSREMVRSYSDPRIRLLENERNMRVAATLNRGLDEATGEYIARMDADDVSLPRRLEKQVAFMDRQPEIGISGTRAKAFGATSYTIQYPADPERIRCRLLFNTAFAHPSVIMRRAMLDEHELRYTDLGHFEDLELWQRAAECFPCANLNEVLLRYRVTEGSAFHGAGAADRESAYREIDKAALARLGIDATGDELRLHNELRRPTGSTDLDAIEAWLMRLRESNRRSRRFDTLVFEPMLADTWFVVSCRTPGQASGGWTRFASSALAEAAPRRWRKRLYCLAVSCMPAVVRPARRTAPQGAWPKKRLGPSG